MEGKKESTISYNSTSFPLAVLENVTSAECGDASSSNPEKDL